MDVIREILLQPTLRCQQNLIRMNISETQVEAHSSTSRHLNLQAFLSLLGGGTVSMRVQPDPSPPDQRGRASEVTVVCGPTSRNLCAIRFLRQAEFQEFLVANPSLSRSMLTSGPDGYFVWCRIDGYCPVSRRFSDREWLAQGGSVDLQLDQARVLRAAAPVTIRFCNIAWPPDVAGPLLQGGAIARLGLPVTEGRYGSAVVNYRFLILTFAEIWRLIYNPKTGQFLRFHPECCRYLLESETAIKTSLANYVQGFLNSLPSDCGVYTLTESSAETLMGALRSSVPLLSSP